MTNHKSAKASADRAQSLVGHSVSYHNGGLAVPEKAPEIDENKWIDKHARREKMVNRPANDKMPYTDYADTPNPYSRMT